MSSGATPRAIPGRSWISQLHQSCLAFDLSSVGNGRKMEPNAHVRSSFFDSTGTVLHKPPDPNFVDVQHFATAKIRESAPVKFIFAFAAANRQVPLPVLKH